MHCKLDAYVERNLKMHWIQKRRTENQGTGRATRVTGTQMIVILIPFVKKYFPLLGFFNE
jgi:hypothetical protein